jgi:hypothetical protein
MERLSLLSIPDVCGAALPTKVVVFIEVVLNLHLRSKLDHVIILWLEIRASLSLGGLQWVLWPLNSTLWVLVHHNLIILSVTAWLGHLLTVWLFVPHATTVQILNSIVGLNFRMGEPFNSLQILIQLI